MSSQKPHLFIAGGGSGGHVFPGLAVAEEMSARGWRVSWVGRPEGMERDIVASRGLPYRDPHSVWTNKEILRDRQERIIQCKTEEPSNH